MLSRRSSSWLVWLGIGLVGGLFLSTLLPHTPLHAVATDRNDTFAMATGPLDDEVEAVYFLDFLTGDLRARVLGKQGTFNCFFEHNVLGDFNIDPAKNPRFLMTTGVFSIQRAGGAMQYGRTIVYVAEVTTGRVIAYATPWNPSWRTRGGIAQPLQPISMAPIRAAGGAIGVGPSGADAPLKKGETAPKKGRTPKEPAGKQQPEE